jgi:hypothetical protein
MKTLRLRVLLFLLVSGGIAVYAQDNRLEVPGDYFSLEGALELFKKSASPEEFERLLNSPQSKVNNLDLNGDGEIDYIRVIDRNEGNIHAFIIQAIVSPTESQDVAVISLEKLANGKAVLQITGDEDVYGIETIIEPTEEVRVYAGTTTARTVVNVWTWPSVQYVYSPYYSVWVSPWNWYRRPVWWRTWRPVAYYDYYSWWQPYRPYYTICYTPRIVYAHHIYRPYRTTSVVVYNRHRTQLTHYRATYRDDRDRRSYYADNRSRSNQYSDNRNSRNSYDQNRNGNRSYTSDRTNRNQYESRSNNDQGNRNSSTTRVPDARQKLNSTEQGNSRSSVSTWNQQPARSSLEKKPSANREVSPGPARSDAQSRSGISQRSYTPAERNEAINRSGNVNLNRGSTQRESRPPAGVERGRSSETPAMNRSNSSGAINRSGSVNMNRGSTQRESRPPTGVEKGRSSDKPAMNRSNSSGIRKRSE